MNVTLDYPIWVWFILLFVFYRALQSLKDTVTSITKLFSVPTILMLFTFSNIRYFSSYKVSFLFIILSFLFLGFILGWFVLGFKSKPFIKHSTKNHNRDVIRPGNYFIIIVLFFICISQYFFSSLVTTNGNNPISFSLLLGIDSFFEGLMFGRTGCLLYRAYKK